MIRKILATNIEYSSNSLAELEDTIRSIAAQCPDPRNVVKDLFAGIVVCRYYLGASWTSNKCAESLLSGDEVQELMMQNKMMRLGHYLYGLRDVKNFRHMIDGLRRKEFEPAFWEIYCSHFFQDSGNEIEFIKESGIRGRDFDLRVTNKNDRTFNVECKNRSNEINTIKTLYNTINNSYDQFPSDEYDNVLHILIDSKIEHPDIDKDLFAFLYSMDQLFMIILTYWKWQFYNKEHILVGFPQHSKFSLRPDAEDLPTVEPESGDIGLPSFAPLYR